MLCCVVCAGFYEYGQPITPLELGYSVIGWQHAGFSGSSVRLLSHSYMFFFRSSHLHSVPFRSVPFHSILRSLSFLSDPAIDPISIVHCTYVQNTRITRVRMHYLMNDDASCLYVETSYSRSRTRAQGKPFPATERRFVEAVMQFATEAPDRGGLGFSEQQVIISGWSIGGYPAAYAATLYPKIRYLVRTTSVQLHYIATAVSLSPSSFFQSVLVDTTIT